MAYLAASAFGQRSLGARMPRACAGGKGCSIQLAEAWWGRVG